MFIERTQNNQSDFDWTLHVQFFHFVFRNRIYKCLMLIGGFPALKEKPLKSKMKKRMLLRKRTWC